MRSATIRSMKFTWPNLFNIAAGLVVLYLLVVLVQTVKKNHDLDEQSASLRAEISMLESQKKELANNITYFTTDSFREREARAKLGLQKPGENVVIIAKSAPTPLPTPVPDPAVNESNFSLWLSFLRGQPQP